MKFTCPVCFYSMQEPAEHYNICECCGTEFGLDDEFRSHDELRRAWIATGAQWFFHTAPVGWNPWIQLIFANVSDLPYSASVEYSGTVASQHYSPVMDTEVDLVTYAA